MTFGQRLQHQVVRALAGLPPGVQVRLSGKPPVRLDGDTLAPEMQLSLRVLERRGETQPETGSPTEARLARRRLAAVYTGTPVPVGSIADVEIDAAVPLRARHYAPAEIGGPHPMLVYYHGGGFTYGDLETHDGVCRMLCRHAGAHVLAVDYRLAPEHRFPAAVARRARSAWPGRTRTRPRSGPIRDGSGSAATARAAISPRSSRELAAHDGGPPPVLQLLIYPATDFTTRRRSRELFGEGFLLSDSRDELV